MSVQIYAVSHDRRHAKARSAPSSAVDYLTAMLLPPGARVGSYEIVGAVGSGGMGEVYRAHDTKLHRDVAIKVLPKLFLRDPERLARFEREAQALAALNHPNIAQIYGLQEYPSAQPDQSPIPALVMELVEGPTFDELIDARRALSGLVARRT